ncbi:hypothetical protein D0T87_15730 [Bacteroides sp. 51]|nr:hypothetical protein [Bacteroides sp. 51]
MDGLGPGEKCTHDLQLPSGVCQICGCTDNNACVDPDHGPCWWANEECTLCSHCAPESNDDSLAAKIKQYEEA